CQACDQTKANRIVADGEDDGNGRRRRLRRLRHVGTMNGGDHGDPSAHQLSGESRQPLILIVRPTVFDGEILPLDIARLAQGLAKRAHIVRVADSRGEPEEPDHRLAPTLPAGGDWPSRRATESRNKPAPVHSIISSARASSVAGRSMSSALAVLRLITSSNLVGSWTGRSPGFSPLRMRPA